MAEAKKGWFDRTLGSLRKADVSVATALMQPNGIAAFPNLRYDTYVREGYQKNELVFACVDEWCTDIAEAQIAAYKDGPDGIEKVDDNEAVQLLNHPNPWLSGDDYLSGVEMYKRIAGNSFTLKVRSGATKPVQLWLLRPDRVRIVPDRKKYISHYEYRVGADVFEIPPEDIIHHRTRNPYDDFYGMPPLMPASGRTDIDNFMKDMVKGFLENWGVPAGILQVSGILSDQEKALVRNRFRMEFGGPNAGNVMIADDAGPDAPKFTPMSMPLGARGLVIPELDEIDEVRIPMVFRVPQSILGTRMGQASSSYANRVSDREFFTEQQLVPEWKSIASVFTMSLMPDFITGNKGATRLDFDLGTVRSLSTDEDAQHVRVRDDFKGIVLSIQEARADIGKDPDPKLDDVFAVPFNTVLMKWSDIVNPQPKLPAPMPLDNLPPGNVDNLPVPPPQKQLQDPKTIIINVLPAEGSKIIEYDDDGNMKAIRPERMIDAGS